MDCWQLVELYKKDASKWSAPSREEELSLFKKMRGGDSSVRDTIIVRNLRLVLYCLRNFSGWGVPYDELISTGHIGLINAVDRYDPSHPSSARFATYAIRAINQEMMRGVAACKYPMRLPYCSYTLLRRYMAVRSIYVQEHGVEPTREYAAAKLGVTVERLVKVTAAANPVISLDSLVRSDAGNITKYNTFPDPSPDPLDNEISRSLYEYFLKKLNDTGRILRLTERESQIILLFFGFNGNGRTSLATIGKELGISRERVRQIKVNALNKLRKSLEEEGITSS